MGTVRAVLLRALIVGLGPQPLVWLMSRVDREQVGANIGAGLLMFGVVMVVSLIWTAIDGRRSGEFGRTAVVWLAVAVIVAILNALLAQSSGPGIDLQVLFSDFSGLSLFVAGLVVVPALIGAAVGSATSPVRSREPRDP